MRDPLFKDMGLIYAEFSKHYDGKALNVGRTSDWNGGRWRHGEDLF